ncbi:MAG: 30S ribosomal protein S2 [Nanoarchaeota archaeon]|nr:30S ribosomal protein S2 [Nanoarchaeota archaeon]
MAEEEIKKTEEVVEVKEEKKKTSKKKTEKKREEVKEVKKELSLEEKKKAIIEKAKKLAEGIVPVGGRGLTKESVEASKIADEEFKGLKTDNMLIPLEDYVKSGIYLGTKVITPDMKPYVFKRRNDGLAIINTKMADEKIRVAAAFLAEYSPEKIVVACKREAGWQAMQTFSKVTGIRVFTKKYPSGIITNTKLPVFFEPELAVIVDPWLDKNLLYDSTLINIPVVSLCDTNNLTSNIDLIIPCNNKSNKSIGLVFWVLAREYLKLKGMDAKVPGIKEFTGEKE